MLFTARLVAALQLGLAAVAIVGKEISKPAAFPNLDQFGPTLNALPRTSTSISAWITNRMSKGCRDRVLLDGRDPTKFKMWTVQMGDCDMPWYICRENGAEPSVEKLADTLARVPVGIRQFIGDVVHFAGGGGGTAWQSSIVHVSGASANHVGVFLHEGSHCVEGAWGIRMRSGDAHWQDAFNRDSHVADEYAQTNHVENFAQYAGLVIYDRVTNGHLQTMPQYWQINQQIWRMAHAADDKQDWGDRMLDSTGKRCGRRWAETQRVNPATGAPAYSKRDYIAPRYPSIIIESPTDIDQGLGRGRLGNAPPTNCTLLGEHF